jgi:hypothetical protein
VATAPVVPARLKRRYIEEIRPHTLADLVVENSDPENPQLLLHSEV